MVAVKICGVRTIDTALVCAELGVDFAGLNFVSGSRRAVDVRSALRIRSVLGNTRAVGIFRNTSPESIYPIIDTVGLDYVQLHGDETPDICAHVRKYGVGVIKALPISEYIHDHIRLYSDSADILLIDAPVAGSGTSWPWDMLASQDDWLTERDVTVKRPRIFIAGGLTPATVGSAIDALAPDGVDVATGIESAGQIDLMRVRAFHAVVRARIAEQYEPQYPTQPIRSQQ
jgi:phosphoribosylanthranilate isomerase